MLVYDFFYEHNYVYSKEWCQKHPQTAFKIIESSYSRADKNSLQFAMTNEKAWLSLFKRLVKMTVTSCEQFLVKAVALYSI